MESLLLVWGYLFNTSIYLLKTDSDHPLCCFKSVPRGLLIMIMLFLGKI